jgi:hypothetical protein
MTAKDFNIHGSPQRAMRTLIRKITQTGPFSFGSRSVLRVEHGQGRAQFGLFFGTGLIVNGVKYFGKKVKATGITGEKASGIVLFRYLFLLLFGRRERLITPATTGVQLDDSKRNDKAYMLIFATSLDRLLLGMRPYWGVQDKPVHVTLIDQSPQRLWCSIPALLTGRGARLGSMAGYDSHNLSLLSLAMTGEYVIDGEIYAADEKKGEVRVSADDTISVMDLSH